MKKKYCRPALTVVVLAAPVLGFYTVSDYQSGGSKNVGGDDDEPNL